MKRRLLLTSSLALCGTALAQDTLVIAIEAQPQGASLYAREVLRRAYEREGIAVRFEEIPLARSLMMSNDGQIDGEAQRIEGIEASYPNLLPVPYALSQLQARVYARKGALPVQGIEDLQGRRVAVIRGVVFAERLLVHHPRVLYAANAQELKRFLVRGMADYSVGMELQGAAPLFDEQTAQRLPVVLAKAPLYHYLHKRHAALVPRLAAQLKALEAKGELAALRNELIKY